MIGEMSILKEVKLYAGLGVLDMGVGADGSRPTPLPVGEAWKRHVDGVRTPESWERRRLAGPVAGLRPAAGKMPALPGRRSGTCFQLMGRALVRVPIARSASGR